MICKDCANEADNNFGNKGECGVCGRELTVTVNGFLPQHKGPANYEGKRVKCSGSALPAMRGHALCRGCDCHHKRKGEGLNVSTPAAAEA